MSDFYKRHLNYNKRYHLHDIDALVFISGGYLCGDDRNYRDYILRYLRYFHIGVKAFLAKIPFCFLGLEIGKPRNFALKIVERLLLKNSLITTVRNRQSLTWHNRLTHSALQGGVKLTSDSVFALEKSLFDKYELPEELKDLPGRHLFLHIEPYSGKNKPIIEKVVPIVTDFINNHPEYDVWIGADQHSTEEAEAFAEIKEALNLDIIHVCKYDDPLLLCKILDSVDVIVTHKLHVGIVGARLGKSVISFSGHTEKIERLYKQLNESNRSISLKDLTFEEGQKILEKHHNKPIIVSADILNAGQQNFKELENFITAVSKPLS